MAQFNKLKVYDTLITNKIVSDDFGDIKTVYEKTTTGNEFGNSEEPTVLNGNSLLIDPSMYGTEDPSTLNGVENQIYFKLVD